MYLEHLCPAVHGVFSLVHLSLASPSQLMAGTIQVAFFVRSHVACEADLGCVLIQAHCCSPSLEMAKCLHATAHVCRYSICDRLNRFEAIIFLRGAGCQSLSIFLPLSVRLIVNSELALPCRDVHCVRGVQIVYGP